MKQLLICPKCGHISDRASYTSLCGCQKPITEDYIYPTLTSTDFAFSAQDLYIKSKECDKSNLNDIKEILSKECSICIDNTKLDKYINYYEKIREKYKDNHMYVYGQVFDEFEGYLSKTEKADTVDALVTFVYVFESNKFRKPFVVMSLSILEQLFNDYFNRVITSKLTPFGAENLLKLYDTSGIQNCINLIETFLDEPLKIKIDRYHQGFYDRWKTYRNLRNEIIHSNTKYVTKIKVSEIYKFIDISIDVFSKLISDLIKTN